VVLQESAARAEAAGGGESKICHLSLIRFTIAQATCGVKKIYTCADSAPSRSPFTFHPPGFPVPLRQSQSGYCRRHGIVSYPRLPGEPSSGTGQETGEGSDPEAAISATIPSPQSKWLVPNSRSAPEWLVFTAR
jgi:hypothetical protein